MKKISLLLPLLLLAFLAVAQIPEVEPNNSFATANNINRYEVKTGSVNSTTDQDDYFRTIFPEDGTLKIYVQANNNSNATGWLYMTGYDRRKTSSIFTRYISGSSSVPAGATIFDTITVYGRAADTCYYRFETSKAFNYQFSYSLNNLTPNDEEPNNTFATAVPIAQSQTMVGHSNYVANGSTYDTDDYYQTIIPADGTMKIYVQATNQMGASNWIYLAGYDRRKTSTSFGQYLTNNTSIAAGVTIYDTITVYGRAADTFYLRIYSSNAFSYQFRYEITDQSTNDVEPNNSFAQALPLAQSQTKMGHINYLANGSTYDNDDYYTTILPVDGTMKIYVQGVNQSGASNWLYLIGYDRRKTSATFNQYITGSSSIPAGAIIYDTITLYGRAADTFHLRFQSNAPFSYQFRYEITDQSTNDVEPNSTFADATIIAALETKQGHVNYLANGSTLDPFDYYRTVIPYDGTLKVYVEATNTSLGSNWLYLYGYDRRKTSTMFGKYLSGTSSIPKGATIRDTITVYSRAADTTYFRFEASSAFAYKLRYEVVDTSANDTEPNNSFAQATTLSGNQVRQGHSGYAFNGTTEADDYYKTEFASNDSLKLYIQATNMTGASDHFYLYGYNAAQSQIYNRYRYNIPAGATIFDSIKIAVTAPQTIYNRISTGSGGFTYQLNLNSRLPGNGFTISGGATACAGSRQYKAINMALNDAGVVYHWSITGGGTINFTDSMATVNWSTPGVYTIKLYTSNADGNSVTKSLIVTVNAGAPPTAPSITQNGRYLSIASLPAVATRLWYLNAVLLPTNDSAIYASDGGAYTAAYSNDCGIGAISATINLNAGQAQTISFAGNADVVFSPDSFRLLQASATSGLPITFKILSGPGKLSGDTLRPTAFGTVIIQALQYGNTDWLQATPKNDTILVTKGSQTITFNPIPNKIFTSATPTFALDAQASSGLATSYQIVSGPATVSGSILRMTGAGTVQVKAKQTGNANYQAAPDVTQSFCIGVRNIDPIKGPATVCIGTLRFTSKKITGVIYEWNLSSGGNLVESNDTAIVSWTTGGTHTLSVKGYTNCDTVRSATQSFTVFVDTAFNVATPTGLTPPDNETGLSLPVAFQWGSSAKASSYDLYVWPTSAPQPILPLDSGLIQTNYQLGDNIALNQPYSWKVVARNVCSAAPSAIQQFTVAQNSSARPDLVMDTFAFPVTIYQGQPITVTWRVKNNGLNGTGIATWKDRVYITAVNDIRVGGSILLGAFNNPSFLLPGETYTQTKTITIPPGTSGTWFLSVITDNEEAFCFTSTCDIMWAPRGNHHENKVKENNEYNNYLWYAIPVLDGAVADLKVKNIGVPTTVFGGSLITATYTVKNEGVVSAIGKKQGSCPQRGWTDRFFISKEPVFDITKAKELASKPVAFYKSGTSDCSTEALPYIDYLLPDSSYTLQHQLSIPYDYFGTQYIYVYTNGYKDAFEGPFSTNNIRRTDSINVTVAPPSDLVVSSIVNIANKMSGNQININWTVANQGANPPQETGWTDSIFVCNAPVFDQSAVLMRFAMSSKKNPGFIQGASYNQAIRLSIPDNAPTGTYYVFVRTDAMEEVFEFDQEFNNTTRSNAFTITLQNPIDLIVTSISLPDSVSEAIPFKVTYTLKNIGSRTVEAYWQDAVYASDDSLLNSAGRLTNYFVHSSDTLIPGASKTYSVQTIIQREHYLSNSEAYIKIMADNRNQIYEHNAEGNNYFVSMPVWVKANPLDTIARNADIKVLSFNAPATANANSTVNVSWTVKNTGSEATTKTSWYDRVFLSEDSIPTQFDYLLSSKTISDYRINGLKTDSSYIVNATIEIPYKTYGNWHLIMRTDYNRSILNDSVLENNTIVLPLQIIPAPTSDLTIIPMNALPDSIWGGQSFWVSFKVQNNGPVATLTEYYDRIYASQNNYPSGYQAASLPHPTTLLPGASYTDSALITIPNYFVGAYYILVQTDGRNEVFEGEFGKANNYNARAVTVLPYNTRPAPDLIISKVTVPDSVIVGKNITAAFTVKNIGLNPAVGSLANAFYLSKNALYESNLDKLLAANDDLVINLLPGDSVMTQLAGKAIPDATGLYHGLVRTNVRNTVHEFPFTNNNTKASDSTMHIDARALSLGVILNDTLMPHEANYYKVTVPAEVDLSVALSTSLSGNGSNAIHLAYNRVPSDLNFDVSGYNPASLNQQALISSTQAGIYYIKAQSTGLEVNEPISLLVTALPFSVINTIPAVMGKGPVNGIVYGAGFKPNTVFKLRNGGNDYQVGSISSFVNSTQVEIAWELIAIPIGTYDVVAVNSGNIETVLAGAITVQASTGMVLEYTPLLPSVVRPNGGIFTYKGKNTGNVNIPVLQGDITLNSGNAKVFSVTTTGKAKRYSQYASQYDSLMTEDFYTSNKTTIVPFFGRNIGPGEEFTVTIDVRIYRLSLKEQDNKFPLQCRIYGYSSSDLAKEQIRNFEMLRRMIVYTPKVAAFFQGSAVQATATSGSKPFIERMMQEFVDGGILYWRDTVGLNLRWDCSRCLQNLPEVRPSGLIDTFSFNPGGEFRSGKQNLGTATMEPGKKMLVEMTASHYWPNAKGSVSPGMAGEETGWDLLKVNGTLNITATQVNPFAIHLSSLWLNPVRYTANFGKVAGWSPIADTSFPIAIADHIIGFDSSKFTLDLTNFASSTPMRRGSFALRMRSGGGSHPDSIVLSFIAYKPTWSENGVDGVDGNVGEQGSPGGKGGPGNAQHPRGGRGGAGGRGGDGFYVYPNSFPPGPGGDAGEGGKGFSDGGDGGKGGKGGNTATTGQSGAEGGKGGCGDDAGEGGGNGGKGGEGGVGGNGGPDGGGGRGGDGGCGGTATNSSYGGGGGLGGDGGSGGTGCAGGKGGSKGSGGIAGGGPLGPGSNGANGKGGFDGSSIDCGCGNLIPSGNSPDEDKIIEGAIGYAKATIVALTEIPDKGVGATLGQIMEHMDQGSSERSPGMNMLAVGIGFVVDGAGAAGAAISASAGATWTGCCKAAVAGLKIGDYINQQRFGGKDYPGSTIIKDLINNITTVSSVPDLLAAAAKYGMLGGGNSLSMLAIPCDPNEIKGPLGYAQDQMVSTKETMPYIIHFENDSLLAEVAAQRVIVRQKISPNADPLTFRVGNFNFGGHSFLVPSDKANYFTTINMDSLGYRVDVTAGVDIVKREAFWVFQTIDPSTGLVPANPFTGLLPVNDAEGRGTGFVNYSIKPIATAQTGDSIIAKASIVFDQNDPVETNTWVNIVDAVAPTSSLANLPPTSNNPVVNLHYSGIDDLYGSGIKNVDIYLSDNGATPLIFAKDFIASDTLFYGEQNHTYTFYAQAKDNVGNIELLKNMGSVTITNNSCLGGMIAFTSNKNGSTYQWQVNTGTGFTNITNDTIYGGVNSPILQLNNAPGTYYGYEYRCVVNGNINSASTTLRFASFWEGGTSKSWNDPANWSCGTVPNEYTDVVIPSSKVRFPDVTTNVVVRSLRVNTGAIVTVKAGANVSVLK